MDVVEEPLNKTDNAASDSDSSSQKSSFEESSQREAGQLNIGRLLIEARENQNLTANDIAEQMNLTVSVILKIESNEFEQDIPIAFIRGYVRSYAQKVGVDVENICAEFDRQTGQENVAVQKIKTVSDFKKRREINSNSFVFKLITFAILLVLFILGGWELVKRLDSPQAPTEQSVTEIQLDSQDPISQTVTSTFETAQSDATPTDLVVDNAQSDRLSSDKDKTFEPSGSGSATSPIESEVSSQNSPQAAQFNPSSNASESATDQKQIATEQAPVNIQAAPAQVEKRIPLITGPLEEVVFTFTADCWVRVTDANGEVMALGLKKAGKVMPVEGIAPINVTLGEPTAVTIDFKGESYDMSRFRAGRAARFVLE
ncbi:DUF4115 domain-containing protein [Aliikangiella marina]|uniref:DUF4115 domain-containing protein n=1 Tax=Aliikangiella marina TaxID=1712262 RepID=A0A545TD17_9GAMM|nr:RodZ domain-containing protein [Aliikangiella marina]TQV75114.1 DUF4115 domain-containing protein [Aliikangiella marina]